MLISQRVPNLSRPYQTHVFIGKIGEIFGKDDTCKDLNPSFRSVAICSEPILLVVKIILWVVVWNMSYFSIYIYICTYIWLYIYILGIIIPIFSYFSGVLKPPTSSSFSVNSEICPQSDCGCWKPPWINPHRAGWP